MILGAVSYTGEFSKNQDDSLNKLLSGVNWDEAELTSFSYKGLRTFFLRDTRIPHPEYQPWYIDEQNERVVIVQGQIYNPERIGANQTNLPEIIAAKFATDKLSFIEGFNGAFSICIFDFSCDKFYLVKDHVGIMPLSFTTKDDALFFSSDTMGMTKALFGNEKIDHEYIISSFYHFEENFAFTPNKNVVKIVPGSYAEIDVNGHTQKKYWFPERIKQKKWNYDEAIKELRKIVLSSVHNRSDKRYTAGTHISGGLDSCLVSAISRMAYKDQALFFGFTWSPDTKIDADQLNFDERKLIQQQAEKSDIKIVYSNFTIDDYHAHLQDWRAPSESTFEQNILKAANEKNVNLLFSGWGGDEFISMGKPYLEYYLFWRGNWGKYLQIHPLPKKKAFVRSLVGNVFFPSRTIPYLIFKTAPFLHKYIKKGMPSNKLNPIKRSTYTKRRGIHIGLLEYKHLAQRCEDWYTKGQRNGVEYRYPLLDKRIIEFVLTLPTTFFVKDKLDRNLIREIGKEWLVDDVNYLPSKGDPAFGKVFNDILQEANWEYSKELDVFRENEYLNFFDFDSLEEDITQSLESEEKLSRELLLVIPYVKMVHEFTISFHSKK